MLNVNMLSVAMLNVFMLNVIMLNVNFTHGSPERHYAKCHCTECRGAISFGFLRNCTNLVLVALAIFVHSTNYVFE